MTARAEGATSEPAQLGRLRARLAEVADLRRASALLFWDQSTGMPPGGEASRADTAATVERVLHERMTHPELGLLLDELEPWAADEDPASVPARMVALTRRDFERDRRVPVDLAGELAHASSRGEAVWQRAREASDFRLFRDALETQVELRQRFIATQPVTAHPYDVLLDLYEPGLTEGALDPLLSALAEALPPLVSRAAAASADVEDVLRRPTSVEGQRGLVEEVLATVGTHPHGWRLDSAAHPFAVSLGRGDVRITTRYEADDLGMALYSALHEFGHGLYESQVDAALDRTTLDEVESLALHESQSRLWENLVGRSPAFLSWLRPLIGRHLPPLADVDGRTLLQATNLVRPSPIRIEADETTYNLHIVLRHQLERALFDGSLRVEDLPTAWNEGMERLLGVTVRDDAEGVLQDVHWGAGMFGYFPTYALGNMIAASLWRQVERDLPAIDEDLAAGRFSPLRDWLGTHVHRHGRMLDARALLRQVTGEELGPDALVATLSSRLQHAGLL